MVILKANEGKKLKFGVSVSGVETRDLVGALRIIIDGIEYGVRTIVEDGKLVADIPPLADIVGFDLKEGQKYDARLDVVAGETFLVPWTDKIRVETPIKVEATITEEEEIKIETKPIVTVSNIDEEEKPKPKTDEMCGADHSAKSKKKKKKKSKLSEILSK